MATVTCFQHIDCEGPGSLEEVLRSKGIKLQILKPFQGDQISENLGDGLVGMGGPIGGLRGKPLSLDDGRTGSDPTMPQNPPTRLRDLPRLPDAGPCGRRPGLQGPRAGSGLVSHHPDEKKAIWILYF